MIEKGEKGGLFLAEAGPSGRGCVRTGYHMGEEERFALGLEKTRKTWRQADRKGACNEEEQPIMAGRRGHLGRRTLSYIKTKEKGGPWVECKKKEKKKKKKGSQRGGIVTQYLSKGGRQSYERKEKQAN